MTSRIWQLVRDFATLSLGETFAKIAGFLAFAYLARALGPAAYGSVEVAVALVMVFGLVVDFGLGPIAARDISLDASRAPGLAASVPAARLLLALPAFAGMALCIAALDMSADARRMALLFALGLFAGPWTLNWLFQALGRMRWVAAAQALRMGTFALAVVLLVRGPEDLWRVGAAELLAVTAMALYFGLAAWRRAVAPGLAFEPGALRRILRGALPVGVSQLLWALNQYLPTLLVATLVGGTAIAWFGSAHRIVVSLGTFVWLYFFNLYPSMVRSSEGARGDFAELTRHSFRATSWIGVFAALLGSLLAAPLCRLAYGEAFGAAGAALALLVWLLPVNLLSGHARFGLIGAGRQALELRAQAWGLGATLVAGIALAPRLGAVGAALAMLISALLVWAVAHFYARAQLGPLPFAAPLLRPAAAAAAAAGLFAVLPGGSPWLRAAAAGVGYWTVAGLLEPRLLGDARALVRSLGGAGSAGALREGGS